MQLCSEDVTSIDRVFRGVAMSARVEYKLIYETSCCSSHDGPKPKNLSTPYSIKTQSYIDSSLRLGVRGRRTYDIPSLSTECYSAPLTDSSLS